MKHGGDLSWIWKVWNMLFAVYHCSVAKNMNAVRTFVMYGQIV